MVGAVPGSQIVPVADTHLAYAVTFHAAEGRTVDSGIAVFTGDEDRQAVNVALTRGRDRNEAYVISGWRIADPAPGTPPAPELARQDRLDRERAGLGARNRKPSGRSARRRRPSSPGPCLDRDGQQMSATETREAEWSDADRLDVLGVQWQHVIREAAQRRYEAAVHAACPRTGPAGDGRPGRDLAVACAARSRGRRARRPGHPAPRGCSPGSWRTPNRWRR